MKIVYIIDSLASKGGAERILTEKMNYLVNLGKYDVYVITCNQFPDSMPNRYPLSDKVMQINLCIPSHLQYKHKYPQRLWYKWCYYHQTRQELTRTVKDINPDIIIGVGYVLANIVCRINCKAVKIIESHEARPYTMSCKRTGNNNIIIRAYYFLYRKYYLGIIDNKADAVVCLTKGDANEWQKAKHVEIIPNFSVMPVYSHTTNEEKRVIAVGRLEWQKGYDRLIKIWSLVTRKHPDWQLDIFGEGRLEEKLKNKINESGLKNMKIHPFTSNINQEYAVSSICVLASRFEGFALVLLEAMRHGVPCVSFDCKYGPKDVVDNKKNGYVIENGDITEFANKICYLIEKPEIRKQFSNSAIKKADVFNVDIIMKQWTTLFDSLISQKTHK